MGLNEGNNSVPYLLGRLFAMLEWLQEAANGATTVKDRYFNAACATPAAVFPLLLRLPELTADERQILLDGCLMNYYAANHAKENV